MHVQRTHFTAFLLAQLGLLGCEHLNVETADPSLTNDDAIGVTKQALEVGVASTFLLDNGHPLHGSEAGELTSNGYYVVYTAPTSSATGYQMHVRDLRKMVIGANNQLLKGTEQAITEIVRGLPLNNAVKGVQIDRGGGNLLFTSRASNIIPNDTNNAEDLFLYDRGNEKVTLINRTMSGTPAPGTLSYRLSDDGRRVAFSSTSPNIVSGDTNELADVFVFDVPTNSYRRISLASNGTELRNYSIGLADVTQDGRYYTWVRSNLSGGPTEVVLYDYDTGNSSVLLRSSDLWPKPAPGVPIQSFGNQFYRGDVLFFLAPVPDAMMANCSAGLAGSCSNAHYSYQCHAYDTKTATFTVISAPRFTGTATSYSQLIPNGSCNGIDDVSSDGRYVVFQSDSSNLDDYDVNAKRDLFRLDRKTGVLERINESSEGLNAQGLPFRASVSNDGRFVHYQSTAPNLVANDPNGTTLNAFLYDRGAYAGEMWTNLYSNQGIAPYSADRNLRMLADANGDGRDDLIGFSDAGVVIGIEGTSGQDPWHFRPPYLVPDMGYNQGYRIDMHPRMTADVNGDGRADLIAFSSAGVRVSRSLGNSYEASSLWIAEFGYTAGGWRVDQHPRTMADVNGDGRDDVVGFAHPGVYVALSTGSGFGPASMWVADYGYSGGWRIGPNPRWLADVNGDGRADVVGVANNGVYVSLSTGTSFTNPTLWIADYAPRAGGWSYTAHPRHVADVDGDGRADILGFASDGVYVSLSTGTSFTPASRWLANTFSYNDGWRVGTHERLVGDVNRDGRADIVGLGTNKGQVALSTGSAFVTTGATHHTVPFTGFTTVAGWDATTPRLLADVTGDGSMDLIGFGQLGTYVRDFD